MHIPYRVPALRTTPNNDDQRPGEAPWVIGSTVETALFQEGGFALSYVKVRWFHSPAAVERHGWSTDGRSMIVSGPQLIPLGVVRLVGQDHYRNEQRKPEYCDQGCAGQCCMPSRRTGHGEWPSSVARPGLPNFRMHRAPERSPSGKSGARNDVYDMGRCCCTGHGCGDQCAADCVPLAPTAADSRAVSFSARRSTPLRVTISCCPLTSTTTSSLTVPLRVSTKRAIR